MGTTAQKLQAILDSKAAIKAAIEAKGVNDVGEVLSEYPDKIGEISSGGGTAMVDLSSGVKFGGSTCAALPFELTVEDPELFTSTYNLFANCERLIEIQYFDTSRVTDARNMFLNCVRISTIPFLDFSSVTNISNAFANCRSLSNLGGLKNLSANLFLGNSPLSHDSLMNVINNLADVTDDPKTLTLGATNLAKLTDEEKAIATGKGWTLK